MADTTVDQEMEQIVSLKLQKAQTEEQIRNVNAELKAKQDKIAETEANIEKRNAEHADLHHNNVQLQEQINEKQAHYDHISTQVSEEADAKMKEAEVALANAQATQVEADAKMEAYTNSVIGAKKKEASLNIVAKQQEVKEKELDEREKTVAKSLEEIELMKQEYAELKAKTSEKTAKTEEWEASLSAREEKLTKRANDVQYREEIVSSREEIVKQGETKLKENIEKARSLFISMEQTKDLLISKFGDKAVPLSEVNAVLDSAGFEVETVETSSEEEKPQETQENEVVPPVESTPDEVTVVSDVVPTTQESPVDETPAVVPEAPAKKVIGKPKTK